MNTTQPLKILDATLEKLLPENWSFSPMLFVML